MDEDLDVLVRAALERRRGEWPTLAKRCSVSHSWISKFVRNEIDNPGYATLKRLRAELLDVGAARESLEAQRAG